jgi:hypothetical protein
MEFSDSELFVDAAAAAARNAAGRGAAVEERSSDGR